MGQVVTFDARKRASKAHDRFPPIVAQETIDTAEAAQQRRSLGVSIKWCLITLGAMALLSLIMGG